MSAEQAGHEPPWVMNIPEAGARYLGLGRSASYAAARRGELPVLKLGRRRVVSVPALEAQLRDVRGGEQ